MINYTWDHHQLDSRSVGPDLKDAKSFCLPYRRRSLAQADLQPRPLSGRESVFTWQTLPTRYTAQRLLLFDRLSYYPPGRNSRILTSCNVFARYLFLTSPPLTLFDLLRAALWGKGMLDTTLLGSPSTTTAAWLKDKTGELGFTGGEKRC